MGETQQTAIARWRLVLGQFAEEQLGGAMHAEGRYRAMDRVLNFLYGREYQGRGVRMPSGADRSGGLEQSVLTVPDWIKNVRELFPNDTAEVLQRHALDRYGMTELVTDPEVLNKLEPSYELLKAVLAFKEMMSPEVLATARRIVRRVIEELRRKLARDVRRVLWGRLNKLRRSRLKVCRNLDWRRTIRDNLRHYDRDRRAIVVQNLHFFSRVEHHVPWHIIVAVDCSGSMIDSVIHAAVLAGILKGLPSLQVNLLAFDTAVIDLSDAAADPTEVLMSVQLGGGTDICGALGYAETLVRSPQRTIVVLISDFYEGGSESGTVAAVRRLREAGCRFLGLAALDEKAMPAYDHELAQKCVDAGAEVAALTPQRFSEWLGKVLS